MYRKGQVACFCFFFLIVVLPTWADIENNKKKLTGEVEQSENNDNKLSTAAPASCYLKGLIQEENITGNKENPSSAQEDPDLEDKELMIEWDHWRNRFLQAVLSSTTDILNSDQGQNFQFNAQSKTIESKYPLGTTAWFSCKVMKDCQIKDVCIEHSSGFAAYDKAVQEAVQSLAGSAILKFPSRSRRISVLQAGGVERTSQLSKQYFHFGDIEHYRIPR